MPHTNLDFILRVLIDDDNNNNFQTKTDSNIRYLFVLDNQKFSYLFVLDNLQNKTLINQRKKLKNYRVIRDYSFLQTF